MRPISSYRSASRSLYTGAAASLNPHAHLLRPARILSDRIHHLEHATRANGALIFIIALPERNNVLVHLLLGIEVRIAHERRGLDLGLSRARLGSASAVDGRNSNVGGFVAERSLSWTLRDAGG